MHCAFGAVTVETVLPICDVWGDGSMVLASDGGRNGDTSPRPSRGMV